MKLKKKLDMFIIKTRYDIYNFFNEERGDTNFISILVLLGIALALAGVFLVFKDQILEWVDRNIGTFFSQNGGR